MAAHKFSAWSRFSISFALLFPFAAAAFFTFSISVRIRVVSKEKSSNFMMKFFVQSYFYNHCAATSRANDRQEIHSNVHDYNQYHTMFPIGFDID